MSRERFDITEKDRDFNPLAREVAHLYLYDEDVRKIFKKTFMKFIDASGKYRRYRLDVDVKEATEKHVLSFQFIFRKHSNSDYSKSLLNINENFILNEGKGWNTNNGISVDFDLEQLLKVFMREYKIENILDE